MTPKELRKRNKELAKVRRRICEDCGANHELSAKHFYPQSGGRGFYYVCKPCWRFHENEKFTERYRHDLKFRDRIIFRASISRIKRREKRNATQRAYLARIRSQQKRAGFARILGVAS